jgi:hypothetical protein
VSGGSANRPIRLSAYRHAVARRPARYFASFAFVDLSRVQGLACSGGSTNVAAQFRDLLPKGVDAALDLVGRRTDSTRRARQCTDRLMGALVPPRAVDAANC